MNGITKTLFLCFSRSFTPVNLSERVTRMLPSSVNKTAHSGFETQKRRHQKSKKGASVASQKGLMSSKNFKKSFILVNLKIH